MKKFEFSFFQVHPAEEILASLGTTLSPQFSKLEDQYCCQSQNADTNGYETLFFGQLRISEGSSGLPIGQK
jgi:hypothetical protein